MKSYIISFKSIYDSDGYSVFESILIEACSFFCAIYEFQDFCQENRSTCSVDILSVSLRLED